MKYMFFTSILFRYLKRILYLFGWRNINQTFEDCFESFLRMKVSHVLSIWYTTKILCYWILSSEIITYRTRTTKVFPIKTNYNFETAQYSSCELFPREAICFDFFIIPQRKLLSTPYKKTFKNYFNLPQIKRQTIFAFLSEIECVFSVSKVVRQFEVIKILFFETLAWVKKKKKKNNWAVVFLCSERNHSKSLYLARCKQRGNDVQCEKETRNDVMFGITVSSRASTNVTNYFHCGFVLILINVSQIKFRAWLALFRYGMLELWPGPAFDGPYFSKTENKWKSNFQSRYFCDISVLISIQALFK